MAAAIRDRSYFIEFERKIIRISEKREQAPRIGVCANWLRNNSVPIQTLHDLGNILNTECEMAQSAGFWSRNPRGSLRKRKELNLGVTDLKIALP